MREIVIEVRCHGCGELIARPSDADMELFRLGVHVHARPSCLAQAEARLSRGRDEDAALRVEERRARDLDDGVIWEDDH